MKDYDCTIEYHLGKANVVAAALSRKSTTTLTSVRAIHLPLLLELRGLDADLVVDTSGALLANFRIRPMILEEIREAQLQDPKLQKVRKLAQSESQSEYIVRGDGLLMFRGIICVPAIESLKEQILKEAHSSAYSMHLGSTKMYITIRKNY